MLRRLILTFALAFTMEAALEAEPIQLHVDLEVAAGHDAALVKTFKEVFKPVISKQPGFVDVKLIKMRKPEGKMTFKLLISFQTEEQRVKWVATADHQKVWPQMEAHFTGQKFKGTLYDIQ